MSLLLDIPDSIAESMRLPAPERRQRLMTELAISLYAQGILSFGKARQLADMNKYEFGRCLGQREISRHYEVDDLKDDMDYASR